MIAALILRHDFADFWNWLASFPYCILIAFNPLHSYREVIRKKKQFIKFTTSHCPLMIFIICAHKFTAKHDDRKAIGMFYFVRKFTVFHASNAFIYFFIIFCALSTVGDAVTLFSSPFFFDFISKESNAWAVSINASLLYMVCTAMANCCCFFALLVCWVLWLNWTLGLLMHMYGKLQILQHICKVCVRSRHLTWWSLAYRFTLYGWWLVIVYVWVWVHLLQLHFRKMNCTLSVQSKSRKKKTRLNTRDWDGKLRVRTNVRLYLTQMRQKKRELD